MSEEKIETRDSYKANTKMAGVNSGISSNYINCEWIKQSGEQV